MEGAAALRRIASLVEKVAAGGWSLRKLEQYGARGNGKVSATKDEYRPAEGSSAAPAEPRPSAPLVVRDGARVVIDTARLERGEIAPEERASLIALLEELLGKTRHAKVGA